MYSLSILKTSGRPFFRMSRDLEKLISKAHEVIDTDQATWAMVCDEVNYKVILSIGE